MSIKSGRKLTDLRVYQDYSSLQDERRRKQQCVFVGMRENTIEEDKSTWLQHEQFFISGPDR